MKLWLSAELDHDVSSLYREIRAIFMNDINLKLSNIIFDSPYDEWAFIAMIRSNKDWAKEVAKRHIKSKSLEFRLKIDHDAFLNGDFSIRTNLLLDSLCLSVDKMEKLGISLDDRNKLYSVLESVRNDL